MNSSTLIFGTFRRHKMRTLFTILSVAVAFAIFLIIAALHSGFGGLLNVAASQRLVMFGESLALPRSYADKITQVPGVKAVSYGAYFSGSFRNKSITVAAVPFPQNLVVNPEQHLTAAETKALLADRQAAVAGADLAREMGWKVGDTIALTRGLPQKNGSTTWYFHLVGIYTSSRPGPQQDFNVHYTYVNEGRADLTNKDKLGNIIVYIDDPRHIDSASHAIDALFATAQPSTTTFPEMLLAATVVKSYGDIGAILIAVSVAVFFSMLLVAGNTMANSVRQRVHEFALMRAVGFSRGRLAGLVLREAAFVIGCGAALGLLIGWQVCRLMSPVLSTVMPYFLALGWQTFGLAALLVVFFTLLTGILPARRATTLAVADTLRRL